MLTGVLAGHATWGKELEGRRRIIEEGESRGGHISPGVVYITHISYRLLVHTY